MKNNLFNKEKKELEKMEEIYDFFYSDEEVYLREVEDTLFINDFAEKYNFTENYN